MLPRRLLHGLTAIAQGAPLAARADVPVHADCDWGNWLADEQGVTALVDFERARFGEPADDWILLAVTSGPHLEAVLEIIARTTTTSLEDLQAACEVRDATFIAEDLHIALQQPNAPAWTATRFDDLEELIGRRWWRRTR